MTWSTSAMSAAARARELGGDEEEVTRRKRLDAPGQAHGGRNGSPTRRIIGRPVGGPVSALAPGGAPGMIRHKIRCAARRGIRRTMAPQRAPPHLAASPRRPMDHLATAAPPLSLAIVGAGPAGLSLALQAALALPEARVTVFDARPADLDIAKDARTLALSLGTVQELGRIGVWDAIAASGRLARGRHERRTPPGHALWHTGARAQAGCARHGATHRGRCRHRRGLRPGGGGRRRRLRRPAQAAMARGPEPRLRTDRLGGPGAA